MTANLHLIAPPDDLPQEIKPTAVQNLLDHFNLTNVFEAFSQSSSKTFKHLPGDFHVSKQGRVDPAGSLKKVLENAPPPNDLQPIVFRPISERQLQAAFTLQDGGYKKKKKKHKSKRDKENGGSGGSEEKKHKKKRHRDGEGQTTPETEPKKKKKKKDKEKEKENFKTIPAPMPVYAPTPSPVLTPKIQFTVGQQKVGGVIGAR